MSDVVYLDVCCLKRPFDDQRSPRVQLETVAVIQALGFGVLDALHAAYAEEAGARWLATTDDRLLAAGRRNRDALGVEIVNPIQLLESFRGGSQ